jgi:hypothetical protein
MMKRKGHRSDREKLLDQVFNHLKGIGVWRGDEFHSFCKWAKGKPSDELKREMEY